MTDTATLWALNEISDILQTNTVSGDFASGVCTDSREIQKGDLYIPLKGERFDGHDYIDAALAAGAVAAISQIPKEGPVFQVDDTFDALQKLARAARTRYSGRIIAITGSAGKTTTKEALHHILASQIDAHKTLKSFNNHLGVPITLAGLKKDIPLGIFEIGMNHANEIAPLSQLLQPHVAMITNIMPVHIGNFSSIKEIAHEKMQITSGLTKDGIVILNKDDECFDYMRRMADHLNIVTFARDAKADCHVMNVAAQCGLQHITANIMGGTYQYTVNFSGAHWPVMTVGWLAAVAVLGYDVAQAAHELESFKLLSGRGEVTAVTMPDGRNFTIIDESYNANPGSMKMALARLSAYAPHSSGRLIAVLGDMGELGDTALAYHAELMQDISTMPIHTVHGVGALVNHSKDCLDLQKQGVFTEDINMLAQFIQSDIRGGDVYMIKGSRGSGAKPRLQVIIDALKNLSFTME